MCVRVMLCMACMTVIMWGLDNCDGVMVWGLDDCGGVGLGCM